LDLETRSSWSRPEGPLRDKIQEYERWIRTLDYQVRTLEQERQKLSAIVNHTDAGFLAVDRSLKVVWANQIFMERFGTASQQTPLTGIPCNRVLCGRESFCAECPAIKPFKSGITDRELLLRPSNTVSHQEMHLQRAGQTRQIYTTAMPIRSPEGTVEQVIVMLQDITDLEVLRRSRDELKEALSLLSATLESTADGILVVNRKGKIASFNRKFVEMWRIPESVMASRDDNQTLDFVLEQLKEPEDFLAKVRELYAQPEADSFDILEFKDGRIFERYSHPQRLGPDCVGRVWSFRDITQRRLLEGQLRQSQKMDAVGQLAGGIAHDFNNLLTAIGGYTDFVLEQVEPGSRLQADVEEIKKATERAGALTHQLLAFSRRQMMQPVVLNLNELVAGMEGMLRRLMGEDIELVSGAAPDLGPVKADPHQLEQVIMNLAVNARDAMPEGGRLTLETTNVEVDEAFVQEHPGAQPGAYAMLAVSDSGSGMSAEVQKHLFEPFFTTKEKGKGTGLGLSTVYGIVKQSGGYVSVYSEPDRGSCFKIYLPQVVEKAPKEEIKTVPASTTRGTETILLVEDEETVRTLAAKILRAKGYTVLEAGDGQEAQAVLKEHTGSLHLLLTDVVMPRMGGPELAKWLRAARRGMKVLFMTGYTDHSAFREGSLPPGTALLSKPFSPPALAQKVRELLDGSKSAVLQSDIAGKQKRAADKK